MSGDDKLTLALEIIGNSAGAKAALSEIKGGVRSFAVSARTEMQGLGNFWRSTMGKLSGLGLGFGAFELIKGSAELEKKIRMVAVAAGKTGDEIGRVKEKMELATIDTGGNAEALAESFATVYKETKSWDSAVASIDAVNQAVTGTGASATTLAGSLSAAKKAFNVDFTKEGTALDFFNKLTAAGSGAGGLENVAGIFEHMASRASLAGLSMQSTMQLINTMGQTQADPEQIGVMSENLLRMFTNLKAAKKAGGMRNLLFDKEGARKDAIEVLKGIQTQYNKLGDESAGGSQRKQAAFLSHLLGGLDARSLISMQMLLKADLSKGFQAGTVDLRQQAKDATDEMLAQVSKLKNAITHAADPFIGKLNSGIAAAIDFMMNKNKAGMSGGHIAATGVAAIGAAWFGGNMLKGWAGNLLKGPAGTAAGVAQGRALQAAAGVTPVFVTNWPAGGIGGGNGLPTALGLPLPGGKASGISNILGKAGLVGSIGMLTFEAARAALKMSGGEQYLEKIGSTIYKAIHPNENRDEQRPLQVFVDLHTDYKGQHTATVRGSTDTKAKTTIKYSNRGSF